MISLRVLVGVCCLAAAVYGRPQEYDLELASEIFSQKDGDASYAAAPASNQPTAVVQVVKAEHPADYVESSNNYETEKAQVQKDSQFTKCSDYTESQGYQCVPYYQCSNGTIITDGAGLIDVRGGFGDLSPEDSKCDSFLDVCCKNPDFIPPPPPKIKYQPSCGRHNVAGVGARIQGFKQGESQFGEWPHMCAVLNTAVDEYSGAVSYNFVCGGSLIAPGLVLTAAHCVNKLSSDFSRLKVRCGEWDTQRKVEPYAHQERNTVHMAVHPYFNGKNLANDVALLFMDTPFELDYHVDTVCLPRPNEAFDFTRCVATGWGKDRFGAEGEYQVVLKEIELNTVNNPTCQNQLRTTKLGQLFKLDPSFMCAGGEAGKDTCTGDGGSPLVCPSKSNPNVFQQVGIVAWGIGCGEQGIPGVYASVSKAACWIDYEASCYFGGNSGLQNSFFGLADGECSTWLGQARDQVQSQYTDAKSTLPKGLLDIISKQYNRCNINWEKSVDVADSGYARIAEPDAAEEEGSSDLDAIKRILIDEDDEVAEVAPAETEDDGSGVNFGRK